MITRKKLTFQQITRNIDNFISNKLKTFSLGTHIGDMPLSMETQQLITKRNQYTHQVIASIKKDRAVYKNSINGYNDLL